MSKNKLLTIAIIGLLVVNLGMVAYLFFGKTQQPARGAPPPRREDVKYIIIERLHFDDAQVAEYEKLVRGHQRSVRELDKQIRETKNNLYASLADGVDMDADSLQVRLGEIQRQMETTHYNHFTDIKKLCKPEQLEYFNELTKDLAKFFAPGKKRPPPPRD